MRAIWSGSLSFGLINIPVKAYSASKEKALKFKMLDKKDLCPIGYSYVCKYDKREVKYEEIVKGFEVAKDEFVILENEDFEKANVAKTKTIEIVSFASEKEIDSKYFDKPYYIEPEERAQKAYVLLREALKKTKKVGVARFVFRDRERIGIIKPEGNFIILDQLRYEDEIREPEGLKSLAKAQYSAKEFQIATSLIDQLSEPFDIAQFKDTYTKELQRVIGEKSKGIKPTAKGKAPSYTEAADLFDVLKKSLDREKKKVKK